MLIDFFDENNNRYYEADKKDEDKNLPKTSLTVMINSENENDIIVCGWVEKRVTVAKVFGKWKREFCVIQGTKLKYYKDITK